MDQLLEHFNFARFGNRFKETYRCYSSSIGLTNETQSNKIKQGGRIVLPSSALNKLNAMDINFPFLFCLKNPKAGCNRETHCGVLEFSAEEGMVILPFWMMENLLLGEGDSLIVLNVELPKATYAKFQPQNESFFDIANSNAVLESALRNFNCLTLGDVIAIYYNNERYDIGIKEVRPENAVCVMECDLNYEVEDPVGYVRPVEQKRESENSPAPMEVGSPTNLKDIQEFLQSKTQFHAFSGTGMRIKDGRKKSGNSSKTQEIDLAAVPRGLPNYNWKFGSLTFIRNSEPKKASDNGDAEKGDGFEAFSGAGQVLKKKRK